MLDNSRLENGPGNVDDYGFNFTLMHPLNLWKVQNGTFEKLVLGPKCIGPKYIWAKVGFGPKYSLGRNVPWGQSECGAKVVLGPNWMWAYVYGVHKVIIKNSSIFSHNAINVAQFCHVKWRSKVQRAVIRHPPAAITGNSDQYWFAKASITLVVYICAGLLHLAVESRDLSQA